MNVNFYSIYDKCAGAYIIPFVLQNDLIAIRTFGDCVNLKDHAFNKHPEDYSLYHVAQFDDNTGHIDTLPEPRLIASGTSLYRPDQELLDKEQTAKPMKLVKEA